jgi:hypothetical protein
MATEVQQLERDLERMARDNRAQQSGTSQAMRDAANRIRSTRLQDRINYSRQTMGAPSREFARNVERQIQTDLDSVASRVQRLASASAAGTDSAQRVARSLDRARDVVRGLSSIDERMRQRAGQGERGAPGQPGQPEQQGQQGQGGRQGQGQGQGQGTQQGGQGGPREGGGVPGERGMPGQLGGSGQGVSAGGRLSAEDIRQFSRELRSQRESAQELRRGLAGTGVPTADLDRLIARLRQLEDGKTFDDPEELERLQDAVLEGFKEFEFGLRRQLGATSKEGPVLGGSEDVPQAYRDLVNEYFRSLSRGRAKR